MSDEHKDSIWKKEISFGRKPADGDSMSGADPKRAIDVELEEIKAAAIAACWKRGVALGRPGEGRPAAPLKLSGLTALPLKRRPHRLHR